MRGYLFPGGNHPTAIVEGVGMFLFAAYHVAVIIVLINMLIAMMSHSFEDIQVLLKISTLLLFHIDGRKVGCTGPRNGPTKKPQFCSLPRVE